MKLIPLPAFQDNCLWLLHDRRRAVVAGPGDPQPVLAPSQHPGLQLEAILVTHLAVDHVGGLNAVRDATGAKVCDARTTRIEVGGIAAIRQWKSESR